MVSSLADRSMALGKIDEHYFDFNNNLSLG